MINRGLKTLWSIVNGWCSRLSSSKRVSIDSLGQRNWDSSWLNQSCRLISIASSNVGTVGSMSLSPTSFDMGPSLTCRPSSHSIARSLLVSSPLKRMSSQWSYHILMSRKQHALRDIYFNRFQPCYDEVPKRHMNLSLGQLDEMDDAMKHVQRHIDVKSVVKCIQ